MRGNNRVHRLARYETLEQKHMLAGDVLVTVVDGKLDIEGDAEDNQIAITAGAEGGSYVLTGLDGTNLLPVDPETEVPGAPVSTLTVSDVRGRINVELGDGNDLVAVFDANVRGELKIDTGEGNDEVLIGAEAAAGSELAELLPEDLSVSIKGKLDIDTGAGDDVVSVANASVKGLLKVETGEGADSLLLGVATEGEVETLLEDLPDATLRIHGAVRADLGDGNDELSLTQVKAYGSVHVDAALGDDNLSITGSQLSHLRLLGGDGADEVEVLDSAFAALSVKLGAGDDTLATANVRAKLAFLAGGDGEDTLDELADSEILHRVVRSIEVPPLDDVPLLRRFCGFGGPSQLLNGVGNGLQRFSGRLFR